MRRRVVIIAFSAVVVIGATAAVVAWPRGATPVTEQEALHDYRSRASSADTSQPATSESATLPEPGVYTYAASGQEDVKLGILPAETRHYPEAVTVVIVHGEPGCFTATLNLLDQHSEDTTYCDDAGQLRIDSHTKHQQIGALNPSAAMSCDPNVLVAPGLASRDLACTLSLSGGPAQLTATLTGSARTRGPTSITVSGRQLDAIAVDVSYQISGDLTGSWREQIWFGQQNWLPLRIERDLNLRGLATFTEHSMLELTDTAPMR